MSNNMDDFDFESDDGLSASEENAQRKAGLKQAWDSNPMLKIGAVVAGVAIAFVAYTTLTADNNKAEVVSVSATGAEVGKAPATGELDPEYQEALRQNNEQNAERAANTTTGSAIPTPISPMREILPGQTEDRTAVRPTNNELADWRLAAEARRRLLEQVPEEEEVTAQADVVPLVQPVRPQAVVTVDPNLAKAMTEQMRTIISVQAPTPSMVEQVTQVTSPYSRVRELQEIAFEEQRKAAVSSASGASTDGLLPGSSNNKKNAKVISPAGTVIYAQLMNDLNSDIPGPVLAGIASGPFSGGRAIGEFAVEDEYLVLSFSRIVKDGVSYGMDGVALDPDTTLAGVQTDVDRHYMTRIILPAAAEFVTGFAKAVTQTTETVVTTDGGGAVSSQSDLNTTQEVMRGVEEGADKVSDILDENSKRPITVKVARGTPLGILLIEPIMETDLETGGKSLTSGASHVVGTVGNAAQNALGR